LGLSDEIPDQEIVVYENNAPLLTFWIRKRLPDKTYVPYPLTGAPTINFFGKVSREDADAAAVIKYSTSTGEITITADGSASGALHSEITIQVDVDDTAVPRTLFYHCDVIKAAKPETVRKGPFIIRNM
jgi:hypothetical protein